MTLAPGHGEPSEASEIDDPSPEKPTLLSGGNPQIPKADGDAPLQAYIAAMPGWKRDVGQRLDALIQRTVPDVRKAVRWNSPFLRRRGEGLVPQLPLLHEVCQGDLLPRYIARSRTARRVHPRGGALLSYPRGRRIRRGARGELDPAGVGVARRTTLLVIDTPQGRQSGANLGVR